jgi:hypothetical protein
VLPLETLVARSSIASGATSLFRQLIWQLARHVEIAIKHSLSKGKLHSNSLHTTPRDLADVMHRPDQLEHQLLRYVESGRGVTTGQWHLSYCHDKGNVAGLQLQPAAFVAGNIGIVACPVALTDEKRRDMSTTR